MVLPGCHLPHSYEQPFARLNLWLVQYSPSNPHIQKNRQLRGSRIGGVQEALPRNRMSELFTYGYGVHPITGLMGSRFLWGAGR